MTASEIARELKGIKYAQGWKCLCPVHGDKNQSMLVKDGHSGVLVTCLAGCKRDDIIKTLTSMDLWEKSAPRPELTKEQKRDFRLSEPWRRGMIYVLDGRLEKCSKAIMEREDAWPTSVDAPANAVESYTRQMTALHAKLTRLNLPKDELLAEYVKAKTENPKLAAQCVALGNDWSIGMYKLIMSGLSSRSGLASSLPCQEIAGPQHGARI